MAKTPTCHCSCKGEHHNPHKRAKWSEAKKRKGKRIEIEDPNDKLMNLEMGGEVSEQIKQFSGKEFLCLGVCGKPIKIDEIYGYAPHDGGYADKDGLKWWMFIHCFDCGYDTSLWKIPNRIKSLELERKYQQQLKDLELREPDQK